MICRRKSGRLMDSNTNPNSIFLRAGLIGLHKRLLHSRSTRYGISRPTKKSKDSIPCDFDKVPLILGDKHGKEIVAALDYQPPFSIFWGGREIGDINVCN
jgi:hypothetical protein